MMIYVLFAHTATLPYLLHTYTFIVKYIYVMCMYVYIISPQL